MDAFTLEFLIESENGSQSKRRTDRFYIVQTMASASSRIGSFAAIASKEYDIHLLPWASVADCISDDSSEIMVWRRHGQVWESSFSLEDVVAPTFARLLLCLREVLDPWDPYFSLWLSGSFEAPWSSRNKEKSKTTSVLLLASPILAKGYEAR